MRAVIALAAALTLSSAPDGPRFAPGEAPPSLRRAVARAERAIRAAACDVEERFGEGEPDASAVGCAEVAAAPDIPGVTVGRTSARLRNPANAPPAWARGYVAETDGRQAAAVPPLAFDLGDRVGLLRPIAIRARCLRCHAPAEKLSEATRAWLSRAYPQDRALGYALGDLRGFWWAEAPKR